MHFNLVGQTVQFSPKNKKEGGHKTRTLLITSELTDDGKRYYHVIDQATKETFYALADKYDEYFLIKRSAIAPKNHRETIQNKSQIGYKK
jgi:hypothetical protein